MFGHSRQTTTQATAGELIEGHSLDDCQRIGRESAGVTESRSDVRADPGAIEIAASGAQSEQTALDSLIDQVEADMAAHRVAREQRRLFEPILKSLGRQAVQARSHLRALTDRVARPGETVWVHRLSTTVWAGILTMIAFGEFILNRAAFVVTGEEALSIDVLAITIGVGLVVAAHFAGSGLREIVDRLSSGLPTKSTAVAIGAVAAVLPALALAVIGIAVLREAFFAEQQIDTGALIALQTALLLVAVIVSYHHPQPIADEIDHLEDTSDDARRRFEIGVKGFHELRRAEHGSWTAARRSISHAHARAASIQQLQSVRELASFASGVQSAAGQAVDLAGGCHEHAVLARWAGWQVEQLATWERELDESRPNDDANEAMATIVDATLRAIDHDEHAPIDLDAIEGYNTERTDPPRSEASPGKGDDDSMNRTVLETVRPEDVEPLITSNNGDGTR